jgi:hypothetical protein
VNDSSELWFFELEPQQVPTLSMQARQRLPQSRGSSSAGRMYKSRPRQLLTHSIGKQIGVPRVPCQVAPSIHFDASSSRRGRRGARVQGVGEGDRGRGDV